MTDSNKKEFIETFFIEKGCYTSIAPMDIDKVWKWIENKLKKREEQIINDVCKIVDNIETEDVEQKDKFSGYRWSNYKYIRNSIRNLLNNDSNLV